MVTTTKGPDPNKVKVQLNVPITWALNDRLDQIALRTGSSKAYLVRRALEAAYPAPPSDVTPVDEDDGHDD